MTRSLSDLERESRSREITAHDHEACPLCRGGSRNTFDHYELGKLRLIIGAELGLDIHATQQLDFSTLLDRRATRVITQATAISMDAK